MDKGPEPYPGNLGRSLGMLAPPWEIMETSGPIFLCYIKLVIFYLPFTEWFHGGGVGNRRFLKLRWIQRWSKWGKRSPGNGTTGTFPFSLPSTRSPSLRKSAISGPYNITAVSFLSVTLTVGFSLIIRLRSRAKRSLTYSLTRHKKQ